MSKGRVANCLFVCTRTYVHVGLPGSRLMIHRLRVNFVKNFLAFFSQEISISYHKWSVKTRTHRTSDGERAGGAVGTVLVGSFTMI